MDERGNSLRHATSTALCLLKSSWRDVHLALARRYRSGHRPWSEKHRAHCGQREALEGTGKQCKRSQTDHGSVIQTRSVDEGSRNTFVTRETWRHGVQTEPSPIFQRIEINGTSRPPRFLSKSGFGLRLFPTQLLLSWHPFLSSHLRKQLVERFEIVDAAVRLDI